MKAVSVIGTGPIPIADPNGLMEARLWSRKFFAADITDPDKAAAPVRLALNLIPLYATLSAPFIPTAAASMLKAMKVEDAGWPDDVPAALARLAPGHAFEVPEVLFAKITDDNVAEWSERFAGIRD